MDPVQNAIDIFSFFYLRYICQNPVKAGLSRTPDEYRWLKCSVVRRDDLTDPLEKYMPTDEKWLREFLKEPCTENHLEETAPRRLTDRMAIERVCEVTGCEHVQDIGGWSEER